MNSVKILRNHEQLGKLQIDTTKLLQNKLKVSYATGSIFPRKWIPTGLIISDDLQTLLLDAINSEGYNEIDQTLQAKLSLKEQEYLRIIAEYSGLASTLKYRPVKRNTKTLIDRLHIIQGSIDAGLDNDELIDEFMSILKILHASKQVDDKTYKDMLETYKEYRN